MSESTDVVVVGAGVVGGSIAYYLASQGVRVIILERDSIGAGATTHATGSLSVLGGEFDAGPSFDFAMAAYREFFDLVPRIEEATSSDLLYQRRPSIRLALDEGEASVIQDAMKWQRKHTKMA